MNTHTHSSFFAQAYGTDVYNTNTYSCPNTQNCTTQEATPGVPQTGLGFITEQPVFSIGVLVVLASVLYTATVLVLKKRRRATK